MYTLKIRWEHQLRHDTGPYEVKETADRFVACDEVLVGREVNDETWRDVQTLYYETQNTMVENLLSVLEVIPDGETASESHLRPGRLVKATGRDHGSWFFASSAWLMGPDGKTIERLV